MQRASIWLCGSVALLALAWFCALPKAQSLALSSAVSLPVAATAATLSLQIEAAGVTVSATVASAAQRDALVAAISSAFGDRVDLRIDLRDGVAATWLQAPLDWLAPLASLSSVRLVLNGRQGVLGGSVGSDDEREKRLAALRAALGSQVAIDDQLAVVPTAEHAVAQMNAALQAAPLNFEIGEARLNAAAGVTLDALAATARRLAGTAIVLAGHSDSVGAAWRNQQLSRARAQAVADALVNRGVAASDLIVRGFGAERPLAENASPEGRARNRRVEFMAAMR